MGIDYSQFIQKPKIKVLAVISFVGEIRDFPTQQGGIFTTQDFGAEFIYGKELETKPYIEAVVFQATSRKTSKLNKSTNEYEEAPSFIEQLKSNPLKVGDVISATMEVSGYIGLNKDSKTFTLPKITLDYLFRVTDSADVEKIKTLLIAAKAARQGNA